MPEPIGDGYLIHQRLRQKNATSLSHHHHCLVWKNAFPTCDLRAPVPAPAHATRIDLEKLGGRLYGKDFADWFSKQGRSLDFLFRLAKETGVVLLPGKGFEVLDASARVSLANLTEAEYKSIGAYTRQILEEYHHDFQASRSP